MRRILLVGAMLFAAGCGGDIPAPWSCPVTDAETVEVGAYTEVRSADSSHPLLVWLEGTDNLVALTSNPIMRDLARSRERVFLGRSRVKRGTHLFAGAAHVELTGDVQSIEPQDSAFIEANRNCDLLIELRQKGDDPLTMDVRWIKRVE